MKIVVLFFLVCFYSVCFAENIGGFDFGNTLNKDNNFKEITGEITASKEFYTNKDIKFFDSAQIGVDKNMKIISLAFIKTYTINVQNLAVARKKIVQDYKDIMETLEQRYGTFDKREAIHIFDSIVGNKNTPFFSAMEEISVNNNPKSENVKSIYLVLSTNADKEFVSGKNKEVILHLLYIDQSMKEKLQRGKLEKTSGF